MSRAKKNTIPALQAGYAALLTDLKRRIRTAQVRAALSVNRELIQLYWDIGREIVRKQKHDGWGSGIINRLAADIQKTFPGIEGFSTTNISRMRAFFLAWSYDTILSAPLVPESRDSISAQAVPKLREPNSARVVPKLVDSNSAQPVPKLPDVSPPALLMDLPWGALPTVKQIERELSGRGVRGAKNKREEEATR